MHSAQRCITRTIAQRPALHCAQRFTASVAQCVTLYTPPLRRKPSAAEVRRRSRAQRQAGVLRSVQRKHCQCSNDSKRFTRCTRLHLLSAQRIYSAQRCTASSVAQRAALPGAHRYTAPSIAQCPALHCIANIAQRSVLPAVSPSLRKRGGHRRLAKRERKAPQAKPPAGRGFEGRAPNFTTVNKTLMDMFM